MALLWYMDTIRDLEKIIEDLNQTIDSQSDKIRLLSEENLALEQQLTREPTPTLGLVPKGYTLEQATQAVILVQRMGLLKESTAGWLLIPAEAARLFPGTDKGEADASR